MALRVQKTSQQMAAKLSTATFVDRSLRNHLCFMALHTEYGTAFHLGMIVRTMFASFFLFDSGFGDADLSIYSEADLNLGKLAASRGIESPYSLESHAVQPTARLLALYDNQLQTAPLGELVMAHQRAERNFQAVPEKRLSISTLVQRCQRRLQDRHKPQSAIIS